MSQASIGSQPLSVMLLSGVESFEHVDRYRKAPATALAIDNDDDDNNGNRKSRCEPRERVRRPCSSDLVKGLTPIAITPKQQQYKATNDDVKDDRHDSTTSHVHALGFLLRHTVCHTKRPAAYAIVDRRSQRAV